MIPFRLLIEKDIATVIAITNRAILLLPTYAFRRFPSSLFVKGLEIVGVWRDHIGDSVIRELSCSIVDIVLPLFRLLRSKIHQ